MIDETETMSPSHPRQLRKALRWQDGVAVALVPTAAAFAGLGPSIVVLGAWAAALLWAVCVVWGVAQTRLYAEMASMFPEKSGGFSLYANEGWRKYSTLVGPIATFGYWIGWSVALAVFGLVIGDVIQAQWFPHETWSFYDGAVHVGLPHLIAAALIILVWVLNVFGIRVLRASAWTFGVIFLIPVAIFLFAPFLTGKWHASNLAWSLPHGTMGLKVALSWMFIMGWTTTGTEIVASFTPEYVDAAKGTRTALKWAGGFTLLFYVLMPLAIGGVATKAEMGVSSVGFFGPVFSRLLGGGGAIGIVLLCVSLILVMNSSTADGGRALYGSAVDGLTVKQLGVLNRHRMPARGMTVDLVINLALVFFVGSPIAVLLAGNIGYFISMIAAVTGFILLRKDRPKWPRPIGAGRVWVYLAGLFAAFMVAATITAALNPSITGYGNATDFIIGIGIILVSLVLYVFRHVVQDRHRIQLRDQDVPTMPAPAEDSMVSTPS